MVFKCLDEGEYNVEKIEPYLELLRPSSGFRFCPGVKLSAWRGAFVQKILKNAQNELALFKRTNRERVAEPRGIFFEAKKCRSLGHTRR